MSDLGHKETDEALGKLERRIKKVYVQAYEETEAKLQDYLSRFATKDKIKQEQLRTGKITQDEYNYWRKGQVMIGKRWQEMVDSLAADYTNANRLAMSMVGDSLPGVYALNHDYGTFQVEKGSMVDTSYALYDRSTVEGLIRDNPNLLPRAKVNVPKDLRWNKQHVNNAVLQGILQGESNDKIASRLQTVTSMNHAAAIRNARTMTTGAENAGRTDSYKRAAEMGIELEQEWLATLDGRTRDSHRALDGEHIPLAKDKWHPAKFSNGCRYPGDPEGPPWEVYNCRCTLVVAIKGIDQSDAPRNSKLGSMSYEEWYGGKLHEKKVSKVASEDTTVYTKFDGGVESVRYSIQQYSSWVESLTSRERDALNKYGYTSNNVARYLRRGPDSIPEYTVKDTADQIKGIDSAMKKATIKDSITVYRGVGKDYLGVDWTDEQSIKSRIGGMITDDSFMSTSLSEEVATVYKRTGGPVFEIDVPSGTRGAYIDSVVSTPEELIEFAEEGDPGNIEYLLDRGYSLCITGYTKKVDQYGKEYFYIKAKLARKQR